MTRESSFPAKGGSARRMLVQDSLSLASKIPGSRPGLQANLSTVSEAGNLATSLPEACTHRIATDIAGARHLNRQFR
jgi:hypothetical protein